jgi:hypothetical protein
LTVSIPNPTSDANPTQQQQQQQQQTMLSDLSVSMPASSPPTPPPLPGSPRAIDASSRLSLNLGSVSISVSLAGLSPRVRSGTKHLRESADLSSLLSPRVFARKRGASISLKRESSMAMDAEEVQQLQPSPRSKLVVTANVPLTFTSATLLQANSSYIAAQLTVLEANLFGHVKLTEFVGQRWTLAANPRLAMGLRDLASHFNLVSIHPSHSCTQSDLPV